MKVEQIVKLINDYVKDVNVTNERRLTAITDTQHFRGALSTLKEKDILHLCTITGVDLGGEIAIIYQIDCGGPLLNLKLFLPKDAPRLLSVTDIFPGAVLYERDLMEMLGVEVENHPDPRRLFLPEDWPEGNYPLRKEIKK
jgi:membrane-bound hydrogenase subunit beta